MRALSFLAPLAVAVLGGCSYSREVPPRNNGESKVLSFDGPTGVAPLGAARSVIVGRDTGGTQDCHLGSRSVAHAGLHPAGGSFNGPEHCAPVPTDSASYSLESAACDDDACTVTPDAASSQWLHVAATPAKVAAGERVEARLRVTLKSKTNGALYTDSFVVRFARAARIRVSNGTDSPLPLIMPMMPGVDLLMPNATVVDDGDKPLEVEPGTLVTTLTGECFTPESNDTYNRVYHSTRPGRATLKWELAGVITRSLDLEVVDPSTARSLAVLAPKSEYDRRGAEQDLDEALAIAEAPAVERLEGTAGHPIFGEVRVVLADGRMALVSVEQVETDRATEAKSWASEDAFRIYASGERRGCRLRHGESGEHVAAPSVQPRAVKAPARARSRGPGDHARVSNAPPGPSARSGAWGRDPAAMDVCSDAVRPRACHSSMNLPRKWPLGALFSAWPGPCIRAGHEDTVVSVVAARGRAGRLRCERCIVRRERRASEAGRGLDRAGRRRRVEHAREHRVAVRCAVGARAAVPDLSRERP